jgi:hypothetical protein
MEKDIEKIIREYDYCTEGAGWAAQEIDTLTKAHYFEFMEWIKEDVEGEFQHGVLQWKVFLSATRHLYFPTTDELYNYWLENYKNK